MSDDGDVQSEESPFLISYYLSADFLWSLYRIMDGDHLERRITRSALMEIGTPRTRTTHILCKLKLLYL